MEIISKGSMCEISKAYDHQTGARTMMDEVACMVCEVLEINHARDEALVWVNGLNQEVYITPSRLKKIR